MIEPSGVTAVRQAELIASLSLATDLGVGQPMDHGLRTCLLSVHLGERLGLDRAALQELYYVALAQRIGCTADAFELAVLFDDELSAHARTFTIDFGRPQQVLADLVRHAGADRSPVRRGRTLAAALARGPELLATLFGASCEAAVHLGTRLGLVDGVCSALGQVFERWDGRGWPNRAAGEGILVTTRIARLAADAEVYDRLGGPAAAVAMVRSRAGTVYDPEVAECFCTASTDLLGVLETGSLWRAVLEAEPDTGGPLDGPTLDIALEAIADFIDLKSPYFSGHSSGVARLVGAAAERYGLPTADRWLVERAALVHDLGRVGVPTGIWDKPGPLSESEWERVRLHPYFSERVLVRASGLAPLGAIAASHHERLDGSGYHRGISAPNLPVTARLIAAADVYHAMLEPRPHRRAVGAEEAAQALQAEARRGLLDGAAVDAVLTAAGHRLRRRRVLPAGLSPREIEVLRLVAQGRTNREIAECLGVSRHTASHHVRHIYDKIGANSRAAMALFAMEHDLLSPLAET